MKKLWVVLIMTLLGIIGAANVSAATGNERTWCFTNDEFSEIKHGYITTDITINGITLSKDLFMNYSMRKIRNVEFNKSIYTPEGGSNTSGYIKLYVDGNTDIHILGASKSTSEDRYLTIYREADKKTDKILLSLIDDYKYEYRGGAGYVYLYTQGDGVRIFGISAKNYVASEYAPMGEDEKKEWDFDNYKNYSGTITNKIELDGLKVYATSEYPIEIKNSMIYGPYGDVKHIYVNLKGRGMYDSRYISFPVPKNSDVYVTARSGDGTSGRKLLLRNTHFGVPNTNLPMAKFDDTYSEDAYIDVNGELNTYKINYYGDGEDFVLNSLDSGIRIYKIMVVPRVNKVVESKVWDISNNSKFTVGTYADAVIDGLTVNNAVIEQCNISGYTKRIHIMGDPYDSADKVKFNISDSSGSRGSNVKRTISITANTDSLGIMLVLVNSEGYLIGCADLSTEIKVYDFDYTGTYDEISVYTYYPANGLSGNSYLYSLNNGIAENAGPDDTTRTISVTKGQKYQYYFTAENVSPDKFTYKISYNPAALTVKYIGYGDGSNNYSKNELNIINNNTSTGEITYTIDKDYEKWSGVTVSVIFEAKSTGNTTINYIAEVINRGERIWEE